MADVRRLVALGMVPELAKEVAAQIDAAVSDANAAITTLAPVIAAVESPAAYSETAADIAAAVAASGIMEPEA